MHSAVIALLLTLGTVGMVHAEQDITGIWQTFDDQTGYSRADVQISRDSNGHYNGTIIAIRPLPFKPLVETCEKCKGNLKDAPYVGLQIMTNFKRDPDKPSQYKGGQVLDPLSGNVYKGVLTLNPNGKHLSMRGYVGVSALGRSTTWVRK